MNGKSVNVYSLRRDGSRYISGNFQVREFRCSDGSDAIFVDPELLQLLQKIRNHFGRAVVINSGYRTPTHNQTVGGSNESLHMYGMAADIAVRGVAPAVAAAYADSLLRDSGGIGIYSWGIHVDTRAEKSRWNG